jgi:hypothetical protein
VCADSAFASVKSAVQLRKKGLYFLGMVKTASRSFPMKYLQEYPLCERGDHVAVTSALDNVNLVGCAWNDRKRKLIVGTCGTTLPGSPHGKKRMGMNSDGEFVPMLKEVKRPRIVEMYFSGAPTIDIHNHYRQGGLGLERSIQTQTWWMRVFCTILGIIETDAYVAYIRFSPHGRDMTHREFTAQLARAMLANNVAATSPREHRTRVQPTLDVLSSTPEEDPGHVLWPLIECERFESRRGTNTRAKLNCKVCNRRASSYCRTCKETMGMTIPICGSGTGRNCFVRHCNYLAPRD